MKKTKVIEMVATILIAVLAIVNTVLAGMGKSPLPISSDSVNVVVSGVVSTVLLAWNTWKNRNVTTAAQKGQEITDLIKSGQVSYNEVNGLINSFRNMGGDK